MSVDNIHQGDIIFRSNIARTDQSLKPFHLKTYILAIFPTSCLVHHDKKAAHFVLLWLEPLLSSTKIIP